jgi:hypothetical protein
VLEQEVLRKQGGAYALTPEADAFLVAGRPSNISGMLAEHPQMAIGLPRILFSSTVFSIASGVNARMPLCVDAHTSPIRSRCARTSRA